MNARESASALARANREYDRLTRIQADLEYRSTASALSDPEKSAQYLQESKLIRNLAKVQEKKIDILTRW